MEIRPLNQGDLDVAELESRIELMVIVPNEDGCWRHSCGCNCDCTMVGCSDVTCSPLAC